MTRIAIAIVLCAFCAAAAPRMPLMSLDVRNARLSDVISMLATQSGKSIIAAKGAAEQRISLHARDVSFDRILQLLASAYRLQVVRKGTVYFVGSLIPAASSPQPSPQAKSTENDRGLPAIVIAPDSPESASASASETAVRSIVLRSLTPSKAVAQLRDVLPGGTYIPDDRHKTVVALAKVQALNAATRLFKSTDAGNMPVVFDVRLIDVRLIADEDHLSQELADSPTVPPVTTMYAFTRATKALDDGLRFLIAAGRAQMVATWRLTAPLGRPIEVAAGQQYPLVMHGDLAKSQLAEFGARLTLTTTFSGQGEVTDVRPIYTVPEGFGREAVVTDREATFRLAVRPDQSIVIGGIFNDIDASVVARTPFLERLPMLGQVFARRRAHIKDEACFVITPRIVSDTGVKKHLERGGSSS